jgi:hypothetical protein
MQFDIGRQTLFDDHSGGQITVTLRNNTNQCAVINQNDIINLQSHQLYYFVRDISFNEGVTDAEATCTVTGIDMIGALAQYTLGAGTGYSTSPLQQMYDIWTAAGLQPPYMDTPLTSTSVVSGTIAEDTTVLNRFSTLINSEMGSLVAAASTIYPIPYSYYKNVQYTFGRSGTSGLPYYNLSRMAGTSISANNVIIDYVTNVGSYLVPGALYKRTYRRYTVLANLPNDLPSFQAQFFAETLSDPTTISGELSWSDKAASTAQNNSWLSSFAVSPQYMATLEYKIPGASATSTRIKIEGVSCNVTPNETNWTVYFTDGALYDDYILDSNAGTLGVSRFGWQA